jgi:hypothetical protein
MHEREKSDPAIGAGKPTNKADATSVADAAEAVEQRAGAKGNASEPTSSQRPRPADRCKETRRRRCARVCQLAKHFRIEQSPHRSTYELTFRKSFDANGRIISPPSVVDRKVQQDLEFLQDVALAAPGVEARFPTIVCTCCRVICRTRRCPMFSSRTSLSITLRYAFCVDDPRLR